MPEDDAGKTNAGRICLRDGRESRANGSIHDYMARSLVGAEVVAAGDMERVRAEQARRAVAEERLRLARELHDVVAHSISVIAVQSGVGAHVAKTQPEEAAKALAAIEATSRAALTELRRLLGVLRQEDEPQGDLAPVPGLVDLDVQVCRLAAVEPLEDAATLRLLRRVG